MKPMNEEHLAVLRRHMVEVVAIYADLASEELGKAALDERVMAAMLRVPRHLFVPAQAAPFAYQDMPLPIGFDKTVSQPFMVALMTDLLAPKPHEAVLEIGTGLAIKPQSSLNSPGRFGASRSLRNSQAMPRLSCTASACLMSAFVSATVHAAGLSTLHSTRSWSRRRLRSRLRLCSSSSSQWAALFFLWVRKNRC